MLKKLGTVWGQWERHELSGEQVDVFMTGTTGWDRLSVGIEFVNGIPLMTPVVFVTADDWFVSTHAQAAWKMPEPGSRGPIARQLDRRVQRMRREQAA